MSKFTEWLVEKGYTTSENNIEEQLSGPEADQLYKIFLNEEGDDEL